MSKATTAVLAELHSALAELLLDVVKNGVPTFDKEGNDTGRRVATAAEMSAAIAFLAKNEITADLNDSDATRELREALEARRRKKKAVMPDFLSDEGGLH